MNTLDEIKAIIDKCGEEYDCGLFDNKNICGDDMINIYKKMVLQSTSAPITRISK